MRKGSISFHSDLNLVLCKIMNEFPSHLAISRQKSTTIESKQGGTTVQRDVLRRGECSWWPQRNRELPYCYLQHMQPTSAKSWMTKSANLTDEERANG